MREGLDTGSPKGATDRREKGATRSVILDKIKKSSGKMPAALVAAFLSACSTPNDFVLGKPPVEANQVRSGILKRLHAQTPSGEGPQTPSIRMENVRMVTAESPNAAQPPVEAVAQAAEGSVKIQGFEQAGMPVADLRRMLEALPGEAFSGMRYATSCERAPQANQNGRLTLTSMELPSQTAGAARSGRPELTVYGPECFGNTPQAREFFMNYLGQEIGRAYALANLPPELRGPNHVPNQLDVLMEPHRGPEIGYPPGPVFEAPILHGFRPPAGNEELVQRQQRAYWVELVNSALHVRFADSKQDWRQACMLRLMTTHRAPQDKAALATDLVSRFFSAQDPGADIGTKIRDYQSAENEIKSFLCKRDVKLAIMGAAKDPGLRAVFARAWDAGPDERATYLDFSPAVSRPTPMNRGALDQRTPYMRQADEKLESAERSLVEKASHDPILAETVRRVMDAANAMNDLHRKVANGSRYSPVQATQVARAIAKLDEAFGVLDPKGKERALPLVIQAMRIKYYGDPLKG